VKTNLYPTKALFTSIKTSYLLVILSLVGYFFFAFEIPRTAFWINITLYTFLFGAYLLLTSQKLHWKSILGIGVLFRLVFLFVLPELSDDFHRFYWDGLQSINGTSPFANLPSEVTNPAVKTIYSKLNSPHYYSVYPGVNQLIYAFAAFVNQTLTGFVVTLKLLMLGAELLSFYFIYRIIQLQNKPLYLLSLYFLNPLVVLEFVGSLHFEGFMSCAILGSIYYLFIKKTKSSSLLLGVACAIKIMPFLFIPLYLIKTEKKKWIWLFTLPALVFILTLLPFYHPEMIPHIRESVQLYFGKFEFNSSLYLLTTWLGIPKILLKTLLLFGLGIIGLKLYQKKITFEIAFVWLFTWYLLLSQSSHPWYVAGFLAVSILNKQHYVILWTFLIFLTYITYQTNNYQQQVWVNMVEYLLVGAWFLFEILNKKSTCQV
jgi:alpha-1,6-mannosyltransferase